MVYIQDFKTSCLNLIICGSSRMEVKRVVFVNFILVSTVIKASLLLNLLSIRIFPQMAEF